MEVCDLQKDLNSEIFNYAFDVFKVMLFSDCWQQNDVNMVLRYYIDNSDDGKILVLLNSPLKIFKLNISEKNDFEYYNLERALADIFNLFRIEVAYDDTIEFSKLVLPIKNIKDVKDYYYGIKQYSKMLNYNEKGVFLFLKRISSTLINSDNWKTLNNGISYLNYNIDYKDNMLRLFIDNNVVDMFRIDNRDFFVLETLFDNYFDEFSIIRYGSKHTNNYLSSNNLKLSRNLYRK